MGRKNKKKGSTDGGNTSGKPTMSQHTKRDVMEMVNTLLEKCSNPLGSGAQEWLDFIDIYELIEKIRRKQQAFRLKPTNREDHVDEFMAWLKENGVDIDKVALAKFEKEGWGLKAKQEIKASSLFLSVPQGVMMTTDTAKASNLGFLVKKDRILQGMPNVVLALHLLNERYSAESYWKSYIKTLPSDYTTPLYFKPEEIQLLKGSPIYGDVLNQWRNIARQYAYFYTLFHTSPEAGKLPIKDCCFDDYRWAVSTVMTRQNQIPATEGDRMVTALIPLWDMCNHTNGQITTDYNCEKNTSECYALRTFLEEEQVYIFYGSRSNAELLLHSGFVYPNNQGDRVSIRLGVSKNDPLYSMKSELLARLALLPSRLFYIHTGEDPVDSDLLAFLRVFSMDEESLKDRLTGENSSRLLGYLRDFGAAVSKDVEMKAWGFLATRISLLLRSYPTTTEEDGQELEKFDLPWASRLAIQLRRYEKRILENAQEYALKTEENALGWPDHVRPAEIPDTAFPATIEDVDEQMDQLELASS